MTTIENINDQWEGETQERPVRRLNGQRTIRQGGGGTVLTGDFTTRSQRWVPRCTEQWDATYCQEIIDQHRLVIGMTTGALTTGRSTTAWANLSYT